MENHTTESSNHHTTTTTTTTTTRRLRSLHLPSTTINSSNVGRRFNSLRRPANNQPTDLSVLPPVPAETNHHSQRKTAHIKLVPNLAMTNRCFVFDVIDRELLRGGPALKLGRYSDRTVVSDRLSFKSKVVSRYHAEIWLSEQDGKIYIKDTGSSSGTFVNNTRLSPANTESVTGRELVDGDFIQLGVDYRGGEEPMYRAVKIRLEVDRREREEATSNTYSLTAFQSIKDKMKNSKPSEIEECCICLYCIAPFQALFITPCLHTFHYKCLRPLLIQNHPGFCCPLCREYFNLDASVAIEENEVREMLGLNDNNPTSLSTHQRENTVSEEDTQTEETPIARRRPTSFLQQIASSDGRLSTTIVGSPPRQFEIEDVIMENNLI